jgi:hypothetical protein
MKKIAELFKISIYGNDGNKSHDNNKKYTIKDIQVKIEY